MQNVSSPASQGLKDDDDDDGEGEDAEGEGEKVDPLNVNSERLKAFNVSNGFFLLHLGSITSVFFKFLSRQSFVKSRRLWVHLLNVIILTREAMKVAGKIWQRTQGSSPAAGSYVQPWKYRYGTRIN